MKIRKSFVTNSSSSCYVCHFCGVSESGWDINIKEAGMYMCENEHVLCKEHYGKISEEKIYDYYRKCLIDEIYKCYIADNDLINDTKEINRRISTTTNFFKMLKEMEKSYCGAQDSDDCVEEYDNVKEFVEENFEFSYSVPSIFCPVCNFEKILDYEGFQYLLKITGHTEKTLLEKIKKEFNSHDEFIKFIKFNRKT